MKTTLVFLSALTLSANVWAVTYSDLLPNVINQLPQKQELVDFQTLSNANQTAADSWIAGDVALNLKHENDSLTGNQGFESWEGGARFPVWLPGQSGSRQQIGDAYQSLGQFGQQHIQLMASKQLRQLVWQTKKAEVRLKFAHKDLKQTQILVELVSQKVDAGESPKFDLLLAQKSLLKAQKNVAQKEAAYQVAQQNYAQWTQQTDLPSPLAETLASQTLSLEQHPNYQMMQAQVKAEQAKLELAKASQRGNPTVYVGAKNERDNQTADNSILIAEVSFPIGVDPTAPSRIAEQRQAVSQRQIAQNQAKQQLQLNLLQAKEAWIAAQKTARLSEQQNTLSTEAMKLSEMAYRQGETSIQNLLLMKQQYFEDKLNFKLAKVTRLETIANLNQALGVSLK
ncbi:TolC family protein [Hydrogenovibrio sp. 3SP14C1]|uniref:TolC family protein n=1 Tax=Hydrogenovibrio sp. 3SP14C1 TaxID=3038774 RepID=UPI002415CC82|nr:TolC family protein [Hydrogenovibrio sp. 3SP14C1]MDG4811594.1 TolC family protein [Hydrogenovibrio sp. 3SP14C1]